MEKRAAVLSARFAAFGAVSFGSSGRPQAAGFFGKSNRRAGVPPHPPRRLRAQTIKAPRGQRTCRQPQQQRRRKPALNEGPGQHHDAQPRKNSQHHVHRLFHIDSLHFAAQREGSSLWLYSITTISCCQAKITTFFTFFFTKTSCGCIMVPYRKGAEWPCSHSV